MQFSPEFRRLGNQIETRTATVGVCGMGYVGLPLAAAAANAGFTLIGFDIDQNKTKALNEGVSYISDVSSNDIKGLVEAGKFRGSHDFRELSKCDVVAVCVPTPLTRHREPDLSFIETTSRTIAANMRPGQLIILEFNYLSRHN